MRLPSEVHPAVRHGRTGRPASVVVVLVAAGAAVVGAALDAVLLVVLYTLGPERGETPGNVHVDSFAGIPVSLVLDAMAVLGLSYAAVLIIRDGPSGWNIAWVVWGMNLFGRATSGLVFWLAASDTGEGQPQPDYSRAWVLAGAAIVLASFPVGAVALFRSDRSGRPP